MQRSSTGQRNTISWEEREGRNPGKAGQAAESGRFLGVEVWVEERLSKRPVAMTRRASGGWPGQQAAASAPGDQGAPHRQPFYARFRISTSQGVHPQSKGCETSVLKRHPPPGLKTDTGFCTWALSETSVSTVFYAVMFDL